MRVTEILSEKMSECVRARHAGCTQETPKGMREEGANEGFKDNDNFVRATGLRLSVFTGMIAYKLLIHYCRLPRLQ